MFEFKLPDLGEGVAEGEILHWHVKSGDEIAQDAPLVEVETDKAAVTIPSPRGGKIVSLSGEVGDTVSVGTVLVVIDDEGDGAAQESSASAKEEKTNKAKKSSKTKQSTQAAKSESGDARQASDESQDEDTDDAESSEEVKAPKTSAAESKKETSPQTQNKSKGAAETTKRGAVVAAPATRRLARELGVDLTEVPGSGPGGRVTPEDVKQFAETGQTPATKPSAAAKAPGKAAKSDAPSSAGRDEGDEAEDEAADESRRTAVRPVGDSGIPFLTLDPLPDFSQEGPVETEPVRSIRRKVAHKMATSMILVPHVSHMDEADVTDLDAFRRRENSKRGDKGAKLTMLAFIVKAVTKQLQEAQQFNASLDPFAQQIVYKRYYNIGFAADTDKGLVVPVVRNADKKSIVQIAADINELAESARAGKIDVANLKGGTFTITNVGSLGGTNVIPTINYPEVAILGMGRAADRPVVRDGRIVVRKILPLTLTFDHRIIDGADAARFMTALVQKLADPNRLLLES